MLVNSPFDSSSTTLTICTNIATPSIREHKLGCGKRSKKTAIIKFNAVDTHWVVS